MLQIIQSLIVKKLAFVLFLCPIYYGCSHSPVLTTEEKSVEQNIGEIYHTPTLSVEETTFLKQFDQLFNEDIATQNDAYKATVREIILKYAHHYGVALKEISVLREASVNESKQMWISWNIGSVNETTWHLFHIDSGTITRCNFSTSGDTCDGEPFGTCCGGGKRSLQEIIIDEKTRHQFIDTVLKIGQGFTEWHCDTLDHHHVEKLPNVQNLYIDLLEITPKTCENFAKFKNNNISLDLMELVLPEIKALLELPNVSNINARQLTINEDIEKLKISDQSTKSVLGSFNINSNISARQFEQLALFPKLQYVFMRTVTFPEENDRNGEVYTCGIPKEKRVAPLLRLHIEGTNGNIIPLCVALFPELKSFNVSVWSAKDETERFCTQEQVESVSNLSSLNFLEMAIQHYVSDHLQLGGMKELKDLRIVLHASNMNAMNEANVEFIDFPSLQRLEINEYTRSDSENYPSKPMILNLKEIPDLVTFRFSDVRKLNIDPDLQWNKLQDIEIRGKLVDLSLENLELFAKYLPENKRIKSSSPILIDMPEKWKYISLFDDYDKKDIMFSETMANYFTEKGLSLSGDDVQLRKKSSLLYPSLSLRFPLTQYSDGIVITNADTTKRILPGHSSFTLENLPVSEAVFEILKYSKNIHLRGPYVSQEVLDFLSGQWNPPRENNGENLRKLHLQDVLPESINAFEHFLEKKDSALTATSSGSPECSLFVHFSKEAVEKYTGQTFLFPAQKIHSFGFAADSPGISVSMSDEQWVYSNPKFASPYSYYPDIYLKNIRLEKRTPKKFKVKKLKILGNLSTEYLKETLAVIEPHELILVPSKLEDIDFFSNVDIEFPSTVNIYLQKDVLEDWINTKRSETSVIEIIRIANKPQLKYINCYVGTKNVKVHLDQLPSLSSYCSNDIDHLTEDSFKPESCYSYYFIHQNTLNYFE